MQVEACVREAMSEVHDGIRGIEDMLENLDKDKRNLESKIEKRKADLGRKEKQLSNLEVSSQPPRVLWDMSCLVCIGSTA